MTAGPANPLRELTDRQREVLRLIAAGHTNAQIAEALGVSLDGAKWHVREILSKPGVASREEAAAIWLREQRPAARARRPFAALLRGSRYAWIVAGAAVLAVVAMVALLVVFASRDGDMPSAPPELSPTMAVTATATPQVTAIPTALGHVLSTTVGEPAVDDVLAVLATGDPAAVAAKVVPTVIECVGPGTPGLGPPNPTCPEGVAAGTLVEAFPVGQCEGTWLTVAQAREVAGRLASKGVELYAIYHTTPQPAEPLFDGDFAIALIYRNAALHGLPLLDTLYVDGEGIVSIVFACGPVPPAEQIPSSGVILPPP